MWHVCEPGASPAGRGVLGGPCRPSPAFATQLLIQWHVRCSSRERGVPSWDQGWGGTRRAPNGPSSLWCDSKMRGRGLGRAREARARGPGWGCACFRGRGPPSSARHGACFPGRWDDPSGRESRTCSGQWTLRWAALGWSACGGRHRSDSSDGGATKGWTLSRLGTRGGVSPRGGVGAGRGGAGVRP